MYKNFLPNARALLSSRGTAITFVDVGSRNGVIELACLAEFVAAYGFEPNPVEYERLVTGDTDVAMLGIQTPKYKSLTYSPFALADTAGRRSLYITRGPGASGMLEPDPERLREIRWKGEAYPHNFFEDIFTIEKNVTVDAETLQSFATQQGMKYIDYLKIDVEGSEYEVLVGAGEQLLRQIGVIKAELCFIPFRKKQKLFSEVDLFLRQYGFDLLRYEIVPAQIGFKERVQHWNFGPEIGIPERYGQPLQCDAIYVNRSINNPDRALAQAMVLLEKNYLDEALHIFRTRAGVTDEQFSNALRNFPGTFRQRFLRQIFSLFMLWNTFRALPERIRLWRGWRELKRRRRV